MTRKYTVISHTKIIMLIANSSKDEKQGHRSFTLKYKHELIAKLKAAVHFLLHWRKLANNSAFKVNTIADGKSSWTLCPTTPHTM